MLTHGPGMRAPQSARSRCHHSARNATKGLMREARSAGKYPESAAPDRLYNPLSPQPPAPAATRDRYPAPSGNSAAAARRPPATRTPAPPRSPPASRAAVRACGSATNLRPNPSAPQAGCPPPNAAPEPARAALPTPHQSAASIPAPRRRYATGLGPVNTTGMAATGANFSQVEARGATHTGCLPATSDKEMRKMGPVPAGCGENRAMLRSRPNTAPTPDSTRLSVSNCRTIRPRPAPSAWQTPSIAPRPAPAEDWIFTHAIRRIISTAIHSTVSDCRIRPVT
jgi:hypothetical protein